MFWQGRRGSKGDFATMQYCSRCKEYYAPYSRLCPYCTYHETFSFDCACVVAPDPFLKIMRLLLDEALQLPMPTFWSGVGGFLRFRSVDSDREWRWREIIATFETLQSLLLISFGDNEDVMEANSLMEDLLFEAYDRRQRRVKRLNILCGVALLLVVICATMLLLQK